MKKSARKRGRIILTWHSLTKAKSAKVVGSLVLLAIVIILVLEISTFVVTLSEYNAKVRMRNQMDFYESTLPIYSKTFPNFMPEIREYPGPIPELGMGIFLMPILSCTVSGLGPQGQKVTVPCFSYRELYLFLTVLMSILVVWSPSKKIKMQEFFQFAGAVIFGLWSYAIGAASSISRNLDDDFFMLSDRVTSGQRVSDATTYLVLRVELSIQDYIGTTKLQSVALVAFVIIIMALIADAVTMKKPRSLRCVVLFAEVLSINMLLLQLLRG